MKLKIAVFVAVFGLLGMSGYAATTSGTVEVETSTRGSLTRYLVHWTSDALGNVVSDSLVVHGYLKRISIKSGAGAAAPTAAYDFTILDDMGFDTAFGKGANVNVGVPSTDIPAAATSLKYYQIAGRLNLAVTNAGDKKQGWIALYYDTYD